MMGRGPRVHWLMIAALLGLWFSGFVRAAAPVSSDAGTGALPDGIHIQTTVETLAPTLRAPFLVTLTLTDRSRSLINLKLHRPHGAAIDGRRIDISQNQIMVDGRLTNQRIYRWAISALRPGEVSLAFATMTLRVTDAPNKDWHWTPQPRTLTVRPLPAYLPEYLPVSNGLTIRQQPVPTLQPGQLVDWVWTVRGRGVTESWLRTVLDQQLVGSDDLRLERPEIRRLDGDSSAQAQNDVLAQTFEVRIPILPDPNGADGGNKGSDGGQASLPTLHLPYVDVSTYVSTPLSDKVADKAPISHLAYVTLPGRVLHWQPLARQGLTMAEIGRGLIGLMLGLAVLWLLWRIGRDVYRRVDARRRHAKARQRLAEAQSMAALLAILREVSGQPTLAAMGRQAPNPRFLAAIEMLDRACYGSSDTDIAELRAELVRWLPRVFFR